ncbi:bifunctional diguanylate cyclase/phosphodiesterase [Micromonospora noduli]|uniref:Diguanylate cyclase YfiN n=1 Tax=Micromonospora noduli TaxID=709876 RepID=A0A328NF42_9ACTN|nr:bifunctional diguanylate cyclase/phosphodiesterase [Micromonospora noduli]KAB1923333.1 bifunctional diguanylate cyclase/phosphodiesterase [Micromonospora noduli]RAO06282.1 putative diguanylate cyclase YfiN [Micromonospora noduli]RAO15884.1 putative diguanylate cyclase YfiN [Micromonospora noduli]RAO17735.1 putative diguanylate cyclase YfiN [Micromonospora noduli]RAO18783.1 putative diguanylate cyclase YfiN [Micromonospora noduli]
MTSGSADDPFDRLGVRGTPGRLLVLTAAVTLTALAAAAVGLTLPVRLPADDPLGGPARFGIAVAVLALAQLARLRFRSAAGMVSITWGEAALIVCLYLTPAGWLPSATLLGTGLAWTLLSLHNDRRPALEIVRIAASLAAASALAVSVTTALGQPLLSPPTPILALAVIAGSVTYLLVTAWLGGVTLGLRHGLPIGPPLLAALRGKLLMFVGNVAVGLVVVALLELDPRWLLLLPPLLWLLQQTYRYRLRSDQERRTWRAFAEATAALNQLDERGVASAAVTGALTLFNAELVDVDVARADGRWHRYRGDAGGQLVDRETGSPDQSEPDEHELSRALSVGATPVGRLRVRFPRSAPPTARERDAVAAFGDALAAALHDAATHRELRLVTARSSYEAVHDPLTGLANRAAMLSKGDQSLRQLSHDHPVALLLLDINQFKEVNDTLGHAAGDQLLRLTANRLNALVRAGDLLGRLGGDEFALLLTAVPVLGDRTAPMAHALRQAREIAERLAAPTEVAGVRMSIEVSVGVVVAAAGTADLTELLRRADIAMYQAKEGGGNVAAYDGARDAASTDQLALLAELREALKVDDQLVLALQPAVDLATGAPTGVEALIRWQHPRRGWLNPADFIRPVENSEQLGTFTRYVLNKALSVAAGWAREGLDVPISVNLSARSLLDPRLPAEIAEALRRHQVPPHRLVLEITETVVMSELEVIDEVLATLRSMGVQLAVDDFGTGFSSLTFLTRIAVDELKVDRSFVIRMADSPEAAAIVRTTVGLAHELGLRVVAEGVETAEQRMALAELGCTSAQGYHFFKPMPADKISAVLGSLRDSAESNVFRLRADGAS